MTALIIAPTKLYMINGEVCTLKCAFSSPTVGNNRTLVAAVSGKRIRVMGYRIKSQNAAAAMLWKSLNAAVNVFHCNIPALSTGLPEALEIADCGYFETTTGDVLAADVSGDALNVNVFYIEYTP
jgi:hypothetical protein